MGLVAFFQHEILVFQQNKHLAMPDTQSRHARHGNSRQPSHDIQVSILSQDRDMKNHVWRQSRDKTYIYV